jgi:hypothetical protein
MFSLTLQNRFVNNTTEHQAPAELLKNVDVTVLRVPRTETRTKERERERESKKEINPLLPSPVMIMNIIIVPLLRSYGTLPLKNFQVYSELS